MRIHILVENNGGGDCAGEHGLSLLVEFRDRRYLIDTGAGNLFADNAKKLGVDLGEVEAAFLSHAHYDHSTGFPCFFEQNREARVYLQKAAKARYYYKIAGPLKKYIGIPKGMLENYPQRFIYLDGYADLGNDIVILPHTTENLAERGRRAHMCAVTEAGTVYDDFSHEQTVVFREPDGLVCFNSCSHGGVENIMQEVKQAFPGERVKAFFGGFHMMGVSGADSCSFSKEEVQDVAEKLRVSDETVFYSGHCTGTVAFPWLQEILGDRIVKLHSGMTVEV